MEPRTDVSICATYAREFVLLDDDHVFDLQRALKAFVTVLNWLLSAPLAVSPL